MSKSSRHKKNEPKNNPVSGQSEAEVQGNLSETRAEEEDIVVVDLESDAEQDSEAEALDPLATLTAERDAFEEKWLRVVAEMDNLRKRSRRELVDSRRLAQVDVLRPILGVMDNFERALQSLHENKEQEDFAKFLEGVDLIFQNFQSVLSDLGAQPMSALGQEFDPVFHEAVGQLPREGVPAGQVIEVLQNGFMFGGQVLRPARVIISA